MLILVARGIDFERALASVVYHARSLVWRLSSENAKEKLSLPAEFITDANSEKVVAGELGDTKAQWSERWYDGLGYCKMIASNRYLKSL